jgi:tetratricopeptide (TPR) repeat protein
LQLQAYQEAIADFTKVLELDSGNANAYFNRASTFDAQGAVAQAIADYTRALELDAGAQASSSSVGTVVPPTPGFPSFGARPGLHE